MTVCYCGNSGIFHGIMLSALSVLQRTECGVDFLLLTMDLSEEKENYKAITEEQARILETAAKRKNAENSVRLVDTTDLYRQYFYHCKNEKVGYTPYSYIRLFLDLMDVPDKLIYLDADTMCCNDLKELWDIDISDYEFAAARDKVGHVFITYSYCNSGVLALNMKKIKQTGLFERSRWRVKNRKMMMPDQTSLNFLCESKLVLPYKFNEQRKPKADTVVKHFCKGWIWIGPIFFFYNYKQWDREKVRKKIKACDFEREYEQFDALDKEFGITQSCK